MDESIIECAGRELHEETGLVAEGLRVIGVFTHDREPAAWGVYITVYVVGEVGDGEPVIMEPEKCAAWQWVGRHDRKPSPLFRPIESLLVQGYDPHEMHLLPGIER